MDVVQPASERDSFGRFGRDVANVPASVPLPAFCGFGLMLSPLAVAGFVVVFALLVAPRKAQAATITRNGPSYAVAEIQRFAAELETRPLPPGVTSYVYGNSSRNRADAERLYNDPRGLSNARFGESPHHYAPALALDVFPIVGGVVSNDPADYAVIVEVAESVGLQSGKTWNDWPHVQVRNWRDRVSA